MKQPQKLFLFLIVLSACNFPYKEKSDKSVLKVTKGFATSKSTQAQKEIVVEESNLSCVRGKAEPVIKKERYPNTTFIIQQDSLTAFEKVTFDNGDELIIHNWGCEYYVLTFQFLTTKYQKDTAELAYWYQAANILMTEILAAINAPIDIKRGVVFLESYYLKDQKNDYKNLQLGEEIVFDGSEIRSFVTLEKIEQISKKQFAVIISFAIGPL